MEPYDLVLQLLKEISSLRKTLQRIKEIANKTNPACTGYLPYFLISDLKEIREEISRI